MPTLSREERERARPKPEQDIIRPRDKPRARLDTFRGAEVSRPEHQMQVSEPVARKTADSHDEMIEYTEGDEVPEGYEVKRRKKRRYRRRTASRGSHGNGFFRRVFGK